MRAMRAGVNTGVVMGMEADEDGEGEMIAKYLQQEWEWGWRKHGEGKDGEGGDKHLYKNDDKDNKWEGRGKT